MKFLLWRITIEPYRLAKVQWLLYKLFKIKQNKYPCGHTKSSRGYYCHQPFNLKYCDVINDDDRHEIICKCCGHTKMSSSHYIDPSDIDWMNM